MTELIELSLAAYAVTFVITASSLFEPVRLWVIAKTSWLRISNHKHPIECRMCTGFWTALFIVAYIDFDVVKVLAVYGLSYFLATQER